MSEMRVKSSTSPLSLSETDKPSLLSVTSAAPSPTSSNEGSAFGFNELDKKKKHNLAEVKRRQRLSETFSELKNVTGCVGSSKGYILNHAINVIKVLQDKLKHLQDEKQRIAASPSAASRSVSASAGPSTEEALKSHVDADEQPYRALFRKSSAPMMICLINCQIIATNSLFDQLFGRAAGTSEGHYLNEFVAESAKKSFPFSGIQQLVNGQTSTFRFQSEWLRGDGTTVCMSTTFWVAYENKRPTYLVGLMKHVATQPQFQF